MSSPIILSIEGNIGSGKSTILRFLEENNYDRDIIFLKEPVDRWNTIIDEENKTILENFYQDPSSYSFMFQIMAFATRLEVLKNTIEKNPSCKIIISERSILADQQVFAKMLHNDKLIDKMGITIYNTMANNYLKDYPLQGIIYIDADPDICLSRINKRNRNGENSIELEYLQKCKMFHDEWLLKNNKIKLLHIKTNEETKFNINDSSDIANSWLEKINKFILHSYDMF